MVTLISKFLKLESLPDDKKRSAYGKMCGIVGIILNIFLFAGKFFAGTFSNSVAITADAFNNLSDAGSSVVTLAGFKLAEQKPDPDHPFGHGRIEYLSGLIVSAVILMMAYELFKNSINKIIHPSNVEFSIIIVAILIASIIVKCYMAYYNFSIGKRIGSATLKATGTDSLSDCISTAVVLLTTLIGAFSGLKIDGYCGVAVSLLIFFAGINAARDTLNPLLGQTPEKEFVEKIESLVLNFDEKIIGLHDLIVHDYGPGRQFVSLHAEVPAEDDFLKIHDIIDNLEVQLQKDLGCMATIHMDPVVTTDERVDNLKLQCSNILIEINEVLTLHDFRVAFGETHTNLIFDIVIPHRFSMTETETIRLIQKKIQEEIGANYFAVISVDNPTT
ncbi:MAG: cation diffusion facilitator family transporter [Schaedlerella sp.]|nr:cation diffusion facilitator family transporter [Schaedlerella sp.]